MSSILIQDVSKTFETKDGSVQALNHVSLSIETGDIYGIIGMSGAGKSTLVRCLNFLERPTDGQVLIEGRDLGALNEKELRKQRSDIAMIFQHFNLLMQKNVIDNICFPLLIQGVKKKDAKVRAKELLKTVGLEEKEKAFPAQLSGGQKQRICIARAILKKPKVLILDDSTSAVDTATEGKIRNALAKKLPDMTKIIIAQRISSVCHADQIIIMDGGRVDAIGTHESLLRTNKIYQEIYESQKEGVDL